MILIIYAACKDITTWKSTILYNAIYKKAQLIDGYVYTQQDGANDAVRGTGGLHDIVHVQYTKGWR